MEASAPESILNVNVALFMSRSTRHAGSASLQSIEPRKYCSAGSLTLSLTFTSCTCVSRSADGPEVTLLTAQ